MPRQGPDGSSWEPDGAPSRLLSHRARQRSPPYPFERHARSPAPPYLELTEPVLQNRSRPPPSHTANDAQCSFSSQRGRHSSRRWRSRGAPSSGSERAHQHQTSIVRRVHIPKLCLPASWQRGHLAAQHIAEDIGISRIREGSSNRSRIDSPAPCGGAGRVLRRHPGESAQPLNHCTPVQEWRDEKDASLQQQRDPARDDPASSITSRSIREECRARTTATSH